MSIWAKMLLSDFMAWFSNLKVLLLFFLINCLENNIKNLQQLVIYDFLG